MSRVIVVIGAGLAGLRTAEKLREAGWTERMQVVGAEPHLPYNRPPLTKDALRHGPVMAGLELRRKPSVQNVEWLLGDPAVQADLSRRTIRLAGGSTLSYDGLVLASGVVPRRLDLGPTPRYVLRTLDNAAELHAALTPGCSVVVVGAGFVGCEVAASATGMGCRVTVVDPCAAPLQLQLGSELGQEVRRRHELQGTRFFLGRTVHRIDAAGGGTSAVTLDNRSELHADVVVEAVGSVPAVSFLNGQGLDLLDGVRCDHDLHPLTDSGPLLDVVAVGDVARLPLLALGGEVARIEHWSMAVDTAGHAAKSLVAGIDGRPVGTPFSALPSFWSEQHDLRIQCLGVPSAGTADVRVLEGDVRGEVALGYYRAGNLVGVALVGLPSRLMAYRSMLLDAMKATKAAIPAR